jgi:hypothetical protein
VFVLLPKPRRHLFLIDFSRKSRRRFSVFSASARVCSFVSSRDAPPVGLFFNPVFHFRRSRCDSAPPHTVYLPSLSLGFGAAAALPRAKNLCRRVLWFPESPLWFFVAVCHLSLHRKGFVLFLRAQWPA